MDSLEMAKALSSLPLTVLLVLVLVGGYTGWWIYGSLHRAQVDELNKRIVQETIRADKWEMRFLELNGKLDQMLHETHVIGRTVNGTAVVAADKLSSVEDTLASVREELATIKARGQMKRAGDNS